MSSPAVRWTRRAVMAAMALVILAFSVGWLGNKVGERGSGMSGPAAMVQSGERVATGGVLSPSMPMTRYASGNSVSADAATATFGSTSSSFGDRIVRTADLSLEVRKGSFDTAWRDVFAIVARLGGRVLSASRGDAGGPIPLESQAAASKPRALGDLTIRVPAGRFEKATNALRALGVVRADSVSSEDVTQEFVDLQSRLRHLRAEERVLLKLFSRAKSVGDTLQIENRLGDVQAQIEESAGRIRFLGARTSFSTISLHLAEPGVVPGTVPAERPTLEEAWQTAIDGLVRIGGATLIVGVWASPFVLLSLVVVGARRRMRRPAPQV